MEEAAERQPGTLDLSVALASCFLQLAFPEHGMILSLTSYISAALLKQSQYHTNFFGQFAAFLVLMDILTCCYRGAVSMLILNTRITIDKVRKELRRTEMINATIGIEILAFKNDLNRLASENKSLQQHIKTMSEGGEGWTEVDD